MDYRIGDLIVYGGSSFVCRITDITRLDLPNVDKERLYYVLKPLHQDCVIYNPADNENMLMRHVITKKDAENIIDMVRNEAPEPYQGSEIRQIAEHCKSILNTRDCAKLMELTMSIHSKKQFLLEHSRKLNTQEEMFMRQAEDMLFGELSVALDIPREQVKSYIARRISGQQDSPA
ncbi:MAG: CarD family transcriptional regulator [Synergistaceae bacterium]|jgi:CarD family transcriptional regulator|nr:CarD family transcriptional regulator [Synergistaceae bacterium]